MRTPGLLIFGMVFTPCGWVLDLTSTVAPVWRQISQMPNQATDAIMLQGIWDICLASQISSTQKCNQVDSTYFGQQIIPVAKGLMVASLLVTLLGIAVATVGVRCWRDRPNWIIAGLGGILIFLSGVMTIIPIAWYTYIMNSIPTVTSGTIGVGYCIILGYIGGIMEILGGAAFVIGMCSCCGGWNRGQTSSSGTAKFSQNKASMPKKIEVPNIARSISSRGSSVPYSRDSLDERDYPRAKTSGGRSAGSSANRKPYDADL